MAIKRKPQKPRRAGGRERRLSTREIKALVRREVNASIEMWRRAKSERQRKRSGDRFAKLLRHKDKRVTAEALIQLWHVRWGPPPRSERVFVPPKVVQSENSFSK